MDSHSTHIVKPDQLCVGLHIHLDLPWISHPFAFPSFKINSPEQIAQIRRLGLKEIRYSPAKSDCQPLIVLPRDDTVAAPHAAAESAHRVADDAADQAKQARIKRLRFVGNEGPEKWAGAVAEHEDMMAALLKRDADALSEAIGRHMDTTRGRVREVL